MAASRGRLLFLTAPRALPSLPATGGGRRLETDGVPRAEIEAVEEAVDAAGGRVTVGDVAASAGLPLDKAERALAALAADVAGSSLQVSSRGQVVYSLPRGFRRALRAKSAVLRLAPAFDAFAAASGAAVRVAFGAALVASVALVWAALTAAALAAEGDRSDGRGGGRRGGGGGLPITFYFSPADIFWYFDPAPYRREAARGRFAGKEEEQQQTMSFLAAVFSFVFGDRDPNLSFDRDRWAAVGAAIKRNGGVVVAEELAPFLDLPFDEEELKQKLAENDESFVVPALVRFGGHAEVDERGRLLYTFPSLMATASSISERVSASSSSSLPSTSTSTSSSFYRSGPLKQRRRRRQSDETAITTRFPEVALERPIPFTLASPGQRLAAAALGAANTFGVVALGRVLADRYAAAALASSGFGFVAALYPALAVYAAAYFVIPAVRWALDARRNAGVERRNAAREAAAAALAAPTRALAEKLRSARERRAAAAAASSSAGSILAPGSSGSASAAWEDEIVFDSARTDLGDVELAAFDAKLKAAAAGRRGKNERDSDGD